MSARLCACGCGEPLTGRSARTLYLNERHRQRAYRRRLNEAAKAAGIEPRLSLKTVEAARSTGPRNGDAPARPRRRQTRRRDGAAPYLKPSELNAAIAALERSDPTPDLEAALAACVRAKARLEKRSTR